MGYVDGYIVPVPLAKMDAYLAMAREAGAVWMEHGALAYQECVADDVKEGVHTSFPQAVRLEPGETVIFSWIAYRDRAHRDAVNAKVLEDPRMKAMMERETPFDGKRMFWGGFKTMVSL